MAPPIDSNSSAAKGKPKGTALAFSPRAVSLLAVSDDTVGVNVRYFSRTLDGTDHVLLGTEATFSRFSSPLRVAATSIAFSGSSSTVGMLVGRVVWINMYEYATNYCYVSCSHSLLFSCDMCGVLL